MIASSKPTLRVETRITDIRGLRIPTWEDVASREYHAWDREHLVIDTAGRSVAQNVNIIREALLVLFAGSTSVPE